MPGRVSIVMPTHGALLEYMKRRGLEKVALFPDGALLNPVSFPLAAVETGGAILFADLPGYSKIASSLSSAECAYLVSHFFAWFQGEAGCRYGGIVDKFIGDEIMVVFPRTECDLPPLEAAMRTARAMLENDPYAFEPKIGIAAGPFAIALLGTETTPTASAMGHAVNLAARCVQSAEQSRTVRIATDDLDQVVHVFGRDPKEWHICPPVWCKPKNMDEVQIVEVRRLSRWVRNFDYIDHLKKQVASARELGAVRSDK